MTEESPIATVLLVAARSRQLDLEPWLATLRPCDGYALDQVEPQAALNLPRNRWNVIVIDGESVLDDAMRRELIERVRIDHRWTTVIYVTTRLPSVAEVHVARRAHDIVWRGTSLEYEDAVRRRVEIVALAPWRRKRSAAQRRRHASGLLEEVLAALCAVVSGSALIRPFLCAMVHAPMRCVRDALQRCVEARPRVSDRYEGTVH